MRGIVRKRRRKQVRKLAEKERRYRGGGAGGGECLPEGEGVREGRDAEVEQEKGK